MTSKVCGVKTGSVDAAISRQGVERALEAVQRCYDFDFEILTNSSRHCKASRLQRGVFLELFLTVATSVPRFCMPDFRWGTKCGLCSV